MQPRTATRSIDAKGNMANALKIISTLWVIAAVIAKIKVKPIVTSKLRILINGGAATLMRGGILGGLDAITVGCDELGSVSA